MSVKQFPRQDGDSTADEYKGKVDFAIITIRPYEYRTVLKRFPTQIIARGKWDYSIAQLQSCDSHCYTVAVVRCLRQGTNHAQSVTRDLIDDLNPKWILTVGIAGGVPDSDFTLGDVIVSTYVYDLTVTAQNSDGSTEYSLSGGPASREVERVLASLEARSDLDKNWNKALGSRRPIIDINNQTYSGDDNYQDQIAKSLHRHFVEKKRKSPIFAVRPVVSSNTLVKAPDIVRTWLKFIRHFAAIEMEFAGVYEAARGLDKNYPVVTIRGISDIVGLHRDERWTKYACHSAAAFAHAFIKYGRVLPSESYITQDRADQLVTEKRIIGSPLSPIGHGAADVTISPINERGMNIFTMPIGSEVFYLEINFHIKANLNARIVQVDLTYGSEGFPMAQRIGADGQEFKTDEDLRTLLKPIVLTEYQSKRMRIIRKFLARLPEHFDKKDDDAWDALREDLDYGNVSLTLDVDFESLPGITRKEFRFKLEPGGKLRELSAFGASSGG